MAKFKKNDLITDGNVTLWITEVTDSDYIFTYNGECSKSPIDHIDPNFELYEYVSSHTHKGFQSRN